MIKIDDYDDDDDDDKVLLKENVLGRYSRVLYLMLCMKLSLV